MLDKISSKLLINSSNFTNIKESINVFDFRNLQQKKNGEKEEKLCKLTNGRRLSGCFAVNNFFIFFNLMQKF